MRRHLIFLLSAIVGASSLAAFSVASLELADFEKKSITGSPKLEETIKERRFEELITLLGKEIYQPVQEDKEISDKKLNLLINNTAWSHSLNVEYSNISLLMKWES